MHFAENGSSKGAEKNFIAAAVVAVLVLGGGAVGIVHSILRDAQTVNVGSWADSGQAGSDGRITAIRNQPVNHLLKRIITEEIPYS